MTTDQYRKWYSKNNKVYERTAHGIIKKGFKNMLVKFNNSNPSPETYEAILRQAISKKAVTDTLYQLYLSIGLQHAQRIKKGISSDKITLKGRWGAPFNERFAQAVYDWLIFAGGTRIETIQENFIEGVIKWLAENTKEGDGFTKTANDMVKEFGTKTGLYHWQMLRIARTENMSASNYSALQAMEDEDLVIDKVWISTDDHRTRDGESKGEFNHIAMDGVTKALDAFFEVENTEGDIDKVLHPVDLIHGVAGNVINCRCTIAPKPRRDSTGRLVRQTAINKPPPVTYNRQPAPEPTPIVEVVEELFSDNPATWTKAEMIKNMQKLGFKKVGLRGLKQKEWLALYDEMKSQSDFKKFDLDYFKIVNQKSSQSYGWFTSNHSKTTSGITVNMGLLRGHVQQDAPSWANSILKARNRISYLGDVLKGGDTVKYDMGKVRKAIKTAEKKLKYANDQLKAGAKAKYWSETTRQPTLIDAMTATFNHEMGHYRLDFQTTTRLARQQYELADAVSTYGETNFAEYWCEWYSYFFDKGTTIGLPANILKIIKHLEK